MTIEGAIYSLITANEDLSSVSVYREIFPERISYPAIVYFQAGESPPPIHHGGPVATFDPLFQFEIFSNDAEEARETNVALRNLFNGYSGQADSTTIHLARFLGSRNLFEAKSRAFRIITEISFSYT